MKNSIMGAMILSLGMVYHGNTQEEQIATIPDQDTTMVAQVAKQDTIVSYQDSIAVPQVIKQDSVVPFQRTKIDGVAAVIGEYVILDSDIEIAYQQLLSEGVSSDNVSRCELAGSLFENKLYAHHAVQDSVFVTDAQVDAMVEQQLSYMTRELGTMEQVLKFYRKNDLDEFKKELFEINKTNKQAEDMRAKIIQDIEITPEEVRDFFEAIPEAERPLFGTELELAQIVIEPIVPENEKQKVIDRLAQFRVDIVENGSSFATKAVLYSQDPGSKSKGGKYTMNRQTPFAREFKDVAFSLQEGEVSEPFETDFGWHLLKVDKIRGEEVDVRHILLVPEVDKAAIETAQKTIDSIRTEIVAGTIAFKDAAQKFSHEKETKQDGGQLLNPTTGDTRFELTKIDPILYEQVSKLKTNEVSLVIPDQDRQGRIKYKLITVLDRHEEHIADYSRDYFKIQELALRKKQIKAIRKWQDEKITDTYIKVNGTFRDCTFSGNWLKKDK